MLKAMLFFLWSSFFVVSMALAQNVPGVLDHQGFLTDAQGAPITSTLQITFRIYDAPTGAGVLWQEDLQVSISAGLYHVLLGETNAFDSSLFDGSERYLAIEVNQDGEMVPRQRITSMPYAFTADTTTTAP